MEYRIGLLSYQSKDWTDIKKESINEALDEVFNSLNLNEEDDVEINALSYIKNTNTGSQCLYETITWTYPYPISYYKCENMWDSKLLCTSCGVMYDSSMSKEHMGHATTPLIGKRTTFVEIIKSSTHIFFLAPKRFRNREKKGDKKILKEANWTRIQSQRMGRPFRYIFL